MAIVKGTKQHPVRIVEHRPAKRAIIWLVLLGLAAAASASSYFYGHWEGMAQQKSALAKASRLEVELKDAHLLVKDLEQRVANVNLGAEVDRKASEEVRQEVIALKEQISQLQEENSFYRGLMAPTKDKKGLTFGAVELSSVEKPRTYHYKVVVQQLASNHRLLKGTLQYKVVGRSLGSDVSYRLDQLSDQIKTESIRLRFKYFQTIEGELQLPEDFEPKGIELVAQTTGKNSVTVEKRFGWLVEETL
ncbi:DUF6776 family protein [Agarilytica rhodophyticola]|uniref:DUF6776 family protein n=1 Tax=Agarilytica rhodophyticola TaxID=1737490 RepID=UPI000B348B51|nr:DUF6776 family protein [Agarilytica rhodophyticola]